MQQVRYIHGIQILVKIACMLAFIVVVLGAYTRLTQAGLGCPDWPGCYGHLIVPNDSQALAHAQQAFPHLPVEAHKAWTEMVHRYAAGSLAILIFIMAIIAIKNRCQQRQQFPLLLPLILLGLIFFQAGLGMWTVTLKLLPIVVMGHLLGGLTILALLWWLNLQVNGHTAIKSKTATSSKLTPWLLLGVFIVYCQISLGGWVSANYAGLACIGFPSCNGTMWPAFDFKSAFNIFSTIGTNYQGGVLDSAARITIQMFHRYGAFVTAAYISLISSITYLKARDSTLKNMALLMLLILLCQIILGVLNVVWLLPLPIAVAHNAFAAVTLLTIITLTFYSQQLSKGSS